jgi:ribosomal protein S18 acetylase RimI-like enzyme
MCAALTLAKPEDLDRLDGLVGACHQEIGQEMDADQRRIGLQHALADSPHAAVYLIGPVRAPVGYVLLSFGWSLERVGHHCTVDQIYVRSGVRSRGIASEVLSKLTAMLKSTGIKTVYIQYSEDDAKSKRLFQRAHFKDGRQFTLMQRDL